MYETHQKTFLGLKKPKNKGPVTLRLWRQKEHQGYLRLKFGRCGHFSFKLHHGKGHIWEPDFGVLQDTPQVWVTLLKNTNGIYTRFWIIAENEECCEHKLYNTVLNRKWKVQTMIYSVPHLQKLDFCLSTTVKICKYASRLSIPANCCSLI